MKWVRLPDKVLKCVSRSWSCISTYIYKYIIKHNIRTSTNKRTHFFIRIYLTLCSRKGDVSCVWEVSGDKDGLLFWPKLFLAHSSTSFSSWMGLLNRGSLKAQSPLSAAGSQFGILSPNDSNRPGNLVILLSDVHLLSLFFRLFTQVHLLIDVSVEGQYITLGLICPNLVFKCVNNALDAIWCF